MLFGRSPLARLDVLYRSHAVVEYSPDGTILSANRNFLDSLSYTLTQVKGRKHAMLVEPGEASGPAYDAFWQALRQGRCQQGEFKRVARDGREVWLQATYAPLLDRRGRPVRVIACAADITARKLRSIASEAKVAAILRSQAMIEFTIDGTIVEANENFLAAVGYGIDDIRGQHHRIFVERAEQADPAYQEFWAALARGEYRSGEYKRLGKDGREIWLEATYNPVFDSHGRPAGVMKFAMDVTASKRLTLDLTGQITAIDRSQGVIQFAPDGTILEANENFLAAVGYRAHEIKGRHHRIFVEPDHASSAEYLQFWEQLRAGQYRTAIFKRLGKGGREIWLQATYNPVLGADGRPAKVVKHCTDITAGVTARLLAATASSRVAQGVQASAAAAEELSASAAEIAQSAARSRALIDEVNGQAKAGGRSTGDLEQAASSMGGIVQMIQGVGEQINLLALNATIEAARAGAAGRGFSVVAGEVKNLAGQVTQATNRIVQDIEAMQAVAGIVATSLRSIERSVAEAQSMVNGIASAAEEQSAVTQEISSAMQCASRGLTEVNQSLVSLSM
ncbi:MULTISPECIES: PAS domain-containing methyl-accepting chemotaxis protein [Methylobacterium]|jgi:methyl-accepting chemotaxis protein|uniref:Methyl-accepting chemotaxis protein n=2 Tax=Methylobacterium TaxID=407 RepID=A0A2R4WM82_9HYPH|nr:MULTISPECIES: PAS domain-containing methyl-accepting chemotaxis protein [Methylobacterium]MBZ6414511.1 PAS domain-containing methyl-accepting chemotaxis protein [Methylobacterium sp.]AWB22640.1 methyl-accepting chemotaxis protein [Methylobacterium currus]MBK3401052.1 PAS domain-containing methyl-accepting chemotaxis protein [Methylobacterium ajmalii]MBK3411256.1 PAS domain-containing methyl-accepting chemotaxis protein [Methylobacterium ajmalii]MBK3424804.1 PAS domain-containing methyl-acce